MDRHDIEDSSIDVMSTVDREISSDCPHVGEESVKECMQSETGWESTHMGKDAISDQPALLDIDMVLEPAHADSQAENNEQPFNGTVENLPKAAASSDEASEKGIDDLCDVVKDKDWVVLAAWVLKQNGKGAEWGEIVDTWVKLQRRWDLIEVRQILYDSDCVPDHLTTTSRLMVKAI